MIAFFKLVVYTPLYNGLIFLIGALPWLDIGMAVILFTCLVKLILFPLSQKATVTQIKMKQYEPELKAIKEKYKNDKQAQARETLKFYKDKNLNPFSSFLTIFIQIPIIFSLYYIFYGGGLPAVDSSLLYSFVKVPAIAINMHFLGFLDMAAKSLPLAVLAGLTQYFQVVYSMPKLAPREENASMSEDLARSMNMQMRYFMPILVTFIAYGISGAIALYWTTSNLFSIGQELYIRKRIAQNEAK